MFLNFFSVYYTYIAGIEHAAIKNMSARASAYSRTTATKVTNYENQGNLRGRKATGKDARQRSRRHEQR